MRALRRVVGVLNALKMDQEGALRKPPRVASARARGGPKRPRRDARKMCTFAYSHGPTRSRAVVTAARRPRLSTGNSAA